MKNKRVIIGLGTVLIVLLALRFIPLYSKSVDGCKEKSTTVHKSLTFGSTKSKIDEEAKEFVTSSSAYDCPMSTVTYKLYVL